MSEQTFTIPCGGTEQVAILHRPDGAMRRSGIVIVVGGGPQYRVGGHRQLVLWARALCAAGYPVLRFDYRGMGDTAGEFKGFTQVDDDIRSAVDRLQQEVPGLDDIVLWGECDAASAILLYAGLDARVRGAVLLNPWVRTEALQAQAMIKHYYLQRLMQPSFWKKLLGGGFNPLASLRSLIALLRQSRQAKPAALAVPAGVGPISRALPLPQSMLLGLQRFQGELMLVMSGRDLIAREFDEVIAASAAWQQGLVARATVRHDLPEGDHTFSSARLRDQVLDWGLDWLNRRGGAQ
ncbi:MAG: hydrolase 1, exosortase A system-associated [Inhella sp.]